MVIVSKKYEQIPKSWFINNFSEIKDSLGFGYSDDIYNNKTNKILTDKEVNKLQRKLIKEYIKYKVTGKNFSEVKK